MEQAALTESARAPEAISSELLSLLQCPRCAGALGRGAGSLSCLKCGTAFPIRDGRFPDFLSDEERAALEREIAFWRDSIGEHVYQDESEGSYRRWAEQLGASPSDAVIEIGCGSGALLTRLAARLKVGIDPAKNLLVPTQGFAGFLGSAGHLPFRDASFNLVYFKHSLHHVEDKRRAFDEAVRITRRGGRLVIIEPNASHPQRRLISNPKSIFRTTHLLTRFIGPVETFQTMEELLGWAKEHHLDCEMAQFTESEYDRLTIRQALQKIYARMLWPILPEKYLRPNYFLSFRKPA
jgi:ubiquinone/menaquinone biosynthesis C-methylase UbiE/uncharacterized protein YbaR (Trm112 family)